MHVSTTRRIDADPATVWEVLADVERWPQWTASMRRVELLDPGPLAVGNRVRIKQPRVPTTVWRVSELVPGRSFTWTAAGPGVRSTGSHTVVASDGGAEVTLVFRQEGPVGELLGRLVRGLIRRYVETEAAGLAARAEGG